MEPIHTIGWKFEYKGNKYGNVISDQKPTGKSWTISLWDEEGKPYEREQEIYTTVPLTAKAQIALMENMVRVMKKLEN